MYEPIGTMNAALNSVLYAKFPDDAYPIDLDEMSWEERGYTVYLGFGEEVDVLVYPENDSIKLDEGFEEFVDGRWESMSVHGNYLHCHIENGRTPDYEVYGNGDGFNVDIDLDKYSEAWFDVRVRYGWRTDEIDALAITLRQFR